MLRVVSAIWLAAVVSGVPAGCQTFTISGTVVEHGSNRPLKDAVVRINLAQQAYDPLSFRTGEDGHFTFSSVQPGKYTLRAQRRGFPEQLFEGDQEYSTAIAVGPGLNSTDIVFPLFAGGLITGTVIDEENEPVAQAQAFLFRKGVFAGQAQVEMVESRETDSSGQFRFSKLQPGIYFVAVQGRPWYAQTAGMQPPQPGNEQTSERELDVVYPLTYYSGVTDSASASPVSVAEGGTSELQFLLHAVPGLHVKITGIQQRPGMAFSVNFLQFAFGYQLPAGAPVMFSPEQIEVSGLAPGRYEIWPMVTENGHSEQFGSGTFDIRSDANVDVSALRRNTLTGRIRFEGNGAPPSHPILFLYNGNRMQSMLALAPDGTLRLNEGSSLLPGRYSVGLENAPGYYLKAVSASGTPVPGGRIEIPDAGSVQLSLVAANGTTDIEGVALRGGKPVGGAMVLLIPKDLVRTDFIRRDQSDSDGTFTLPNVPPGHYTLLAINDGHDLLYADSAVMKPYVSQGKEITIPVPNGSRVSIDVVQRQAAPN